MWLGADTVVTDAVVVFARSDDYFFGVLQSRAHEVWALLQGTQLESRPRYTPTTCFETFPFPHGTQEQQWAISIAAKDLNERRDRWLNPERGEIEIGWSELKKRTLTNLYNQKPTWLVDAHRTLDEAVFAAYGWAASPDVLPDAEIVARLLTLNSSREAA